MLRFDTLRRALRAAGPGWIAAAFIVCVGGAHAQSGASPDGVPSASAQVDQRQSESSEDADLETIVVEGIRVSVEQSLAVKRSSAAIVDAITAEDIGKLPDQNIAETLQRVPGVQVNRGGVSQQQFMGEGSGVTIRGIGSNRTEFNGTNIVGAALGGGVQLTDINPDILAGLTVTKSPSAQDIEGALGGVINLVSRKPLDLDRFFVAGRAEGIYYDQAEEVGYRASGVISTKSSGDIFGVLLGVSHYEYDRLTLEVDNGGFTTAIDADGNGSPAGNPATPTRFVNNHVYGTVERTGIDGSIQWRPLDEAELNLDVLYSRANLDQAASRFQVLLGSNLVNPQIDANNTVVRGTFNNVTPRVTAFDEPLEAEQLIAALHGRWTPGPLQIEGRASRSESERYTRLFVPLLVPQPGNSSSLSYDVVSGNDLPTGVLTTNFDFLNPNNYRLDVTVDNQDEFENTGDDVQLDLTYDTGWRWVDALKTGVRLEGLSLTTDRFAANTSAAAVLAGRPGLDRNGDGRVGFDEVSGISLSTIDNFFDGRSGNLPRAFLGGTVDPDAFQAAVGLADAPRDFSGVRRVEEETIAGYLQADFEGSVAGLNVRGNVGARYVDTSRDVRGNAIVSGQVFPQQFETDFSNWLPSMNLAADLREDMLLRLAAGKVITRPGLTDVAPGTTVNLVNLTATRGNPRLLPFTATQYDASIEWYFAPASLLAFAVFYKDVASFTTTTTRAEFLDLGALSNTFLVSTPTNGESGTIKGIELNYHHVFEALPSGLAGLGVGANYAYVDSVTPLIDSTTNRREPLQGLSEHSLNLTAFYERTWGDVRLTYNWRDSYLEFRQPASVGGNRYQDAYGQLDITTRINLTENFSLTASAVNLTDEEETFYHAFESRLRAYRVNDRRVYLGISASL